MLNALKKGETLVDGFIESVKAYDGLIQVVGSSKDGDLISGETRAQLRVQLLRDPASSVMASSASPTTDEIPPELLEISADGAEVLMEFDEIINPATIKASRFQVRVDGKKVMTSDAIVDQDSTFAVLTLPAIVTAGSDVEVSYRDPKKDQSSGVLEDLFGNDVGTFRNIAATVI